MRKTLLAAAVASTANLAPVVHADEGMWVPQQLEIAGPLKKAGTTSPATRWAVVSLGGCTPASSPRRAWWRPTALAYGAIQLNSTAEKNPDPRPRLQPGHPADELCTVDARIYVLGHHRRHRAGQGGDGGGGQRPGRPRRRWRSLRNLQRLQGRLPLRSTTGQHLPPVQEPRDQGRAPGLCAARRRRRLRRRHRQLDVAAPPATSRSTAPTWSKDGKPGAFAQDNVPYQPKHWLKIAKQAAGRQAGFRDGGRLPRPHRPLRAGGGVREHPGVALSGHFKAFKDQIALSGRRRCSTSR